MSLSLDTTTTLIDAANAELCSLQECIGDYKRMVAAGQIAEKPTLDRYTKQAERIQTAILEAMAYREVVRRKSA